MPRAQSEVLWVADSSPVLAVLNTEPGADVAAGYLPQAIVNTVNYSEVVAKLLGRGLVLADALTAFFSVGATVVPFLEDEAVMAAALRLPTAPYGLSFGDRACVATAAVRGLALVTADRRWAEAALPVPVHLIP